MRIHAQRRGGTFLAALCSGAVALAVAALPTVVSCVATRRSGLGTAKGRCPHPVTLIVDAQSVEGASTVGGNGRGYDAAGKATRRCRRHLPAHGAVTADRAAGPELAAGPHPPGTGTAVPGGARCAGPRAPAPAP